MQLREEQNNQKMQKLLQGSVSNQLLTPINVISQFTEMLLKKEYKKDKKLAKILKIIQNSSKLLMCHTRDLLDNQVFELEQNLQPNMQLAYLKESIEDIVQIQRMQSATKNIQIFCQLSSLRNLKQMKFDGMRM